MSKIKKYSEEQVDFVKNLIKKNNSITQASKKMCENFNIPYEDSVRRRLSEVLNKNGITNNVKVIEDHPEFKTAQKKIHDSSKSKFIISWCQNETDIHERLFDNIEAYSNKIDAEVLIIAGRYKNPTSVESNKKLKSEENKFNWHRRVVPYLDANRHRIHPFLSILSDIKTQPTASTPLSGFNGVSGLESCIIGHPRMHMKSLPVLDGYPNKLLLTTGSVSVENYTDTKAGKKGEFHHQFGFVIVELDGDIFHVRQVSADKEGNFYDLYHRAYNGVITKNDTCQGVVFGDLHVGEDDKATVKLSFEMARNLNAPVVVLHDVFNGHSISHHERKDPFKLLQREEDGSWCLKTEIENLKGWFEEHAFFNYVVVRSNHDDFLDRWLMGEDWRKVSNKAAYLKYASILAEGKAPKGIIPYILEKNFENVRCLGIDDSFRVKGWELGVHGHMGANGSRGSVVQFKNLNTKNITAHTHSPNREDGNVCVGTNTHLRVGFNKGMSSWMQSNAIIHNDGKVQQINIIKGRYRA